MKKSLLIIIGFIFLSQLSRAQCTIAASTTLSPSAFIACGSITINTGVSLVVSGTVTLSGNTVLNVINNGTLTIDGDFSAGGNTTVNLSGTGPMNINGNLSLAGNITMATNDVMNVTGNATFSGSAAVSGTGSIAVDGTSTASGSANVFGWTSGSCTGCVLSVTNPTPITLIKFTAVFVNANVVAAWETATEINNNYFTIERSADGVSFEPIQKVNSKAPNGNSLTALKYEFTDAKPLGGTSYYRLRQTDYNGKNEAFNVVSVTRTVEKNITFTIYPNPNQGQFKADFTGIENNHEVQIIMGDENGKIIYSNTFYAQEALNSVAIVPQQKPGKGNYYCSLIAEGIKYTVKVIVE